MPDMPPTPVKPRTFVGDPNPPPTELEAPKGSSAPAAGAESSAGTGALPPEASPGAGGGQPKTADRTYSVVERPDGSRDAFSSDDEGDSKLGAVTVEDADQVLHQFGRYDDKLKMWSGLPKEAVDKLLQGRLPLPQYIEAKYGEGQSVRGLIGLKWLGGGLGDQEAKERGQADLIKTQLNEEPAFAWQGGLGATVAKMWSDLRAAGVGGTARRAAGELVQATPDLLKAGSDAAESAGALGLAGAAVGGFAAGPPGALAGLEIGGKVGLAYGLFKHYFDVTAGNTALDMLDKGHDPATIRVVAPLAGAINGALAVPKIDIMTAGAQRALLEKAASSEGLKDVIARYVANTAKGVGLNEAQQAAGIALTDLAARAESRKDLEVQHPIADLVNGAVLSAPVMAAMNLPFAAVEAVRTQEAAARETPSPEHPGTAGAAPGLGEPAASAGEPGARPEGAGQTPPGTAGAESPLSPGQEERAASATSVASGGEAVKTYDKVLKYRTLEGETKPEQTVARMRDEAQAMRETLAGDRVAVGEKGSEPMANARFIENALRRHEADLAVLEKGPEAPAAEREFFKNPEFEVKPLETDKATAADIRQQYVGQRDEQVARVNQMMRDFRKEVPDLEERQAITRYLDMGGDAAALKAASENEDLPAESRAQYARALELSPAGKEWADTLERFYKEANEVGQEQGTLRSARENYVNRIYAPEKNADFVKSELRQGVKQGTGHALQRSYETMELAEMDGRRFATTDAADLASVYNGEIARANAARSMADRMAESGLGAWKQPGNVPEGWEQVGGLEKRVPIQGPEGKAALDEKGNQIHASSVFVAPEGIAKGLKAISDPDFAKKIDALREVQKYQGLVKTVDLSFSFFHHLSMMAQLAYSGDLSSLLQVRNLDGFLDAPEFKEREQEFVRYGGATAITGDNADILRGLSRDEGDFFSKITQAPGAKQMLELTDKSSEFLFGKVQRLWKVNAFSQLAADWAADHPDATNAEVADAMRGYARHVNDRFGGQNWEAMGMTRSNLSLLRLGMLAPDWTISNLHLLQAAVGEGGTLGSASRKHLLASLAVGMVATESLNKALTGHFTDENKAGHKLEVEIAPDVYVSLLRGGVQDITKLASMVAESGLAGVSRFAQGKLAPLARTGVGLLTNTDYTGRAIVPRHSGPVAGTYDVLKYALNSSAPVPLGISNLASYAKSGKATPGGALAVGTGVGRYSKPPGRGN